MMHKSLTGVTLVGLGALILLQSLGLYNFGLTFWPVLLIWFGLEMVWGSLFHRFHGGSLFGAALGLLVAGIGVDRALANLGLVLGFGAGEILRLGGPVLLIALGLSILFGRHCLRWERHI